MLTNTVVLSAGLVASVLNLILPQEDAEDLNAVIDDDAELAEVESQHKKHG